MNSSLTCEFSDPRAKRVQLNQTEVVFYGCVGDVAAAADLVLNRLG